ncbi:MAG: choice-of-anchor D domain-containing protein [Myxococcus sp.]|nr:choice-of-anchor D domain-containing protein [Myxococcus sp.]
MKQLTVVAVLALAFACDRVEPGVQGTNRGELKIALPDAGVPVFETSYGFGDVKTGEQARVTFEVVNTGQDALDIRVIKIMTDDTGAFFVQGGTGSVAPQVRRTFSVTFAPARAGAHTGNLVFETNANSESARIAITGNAIP